MKIGKANYGTMKKKFKIMDGDNVYRILPPLGSLADAGIWAKYYAVAWGYKNSEGKLRPFVDPSQKNSRNGMAEVVSAALDKKLKLDMQKDKMKKAGATKEQLQKINEAIMTYNIDKKYYVNAVNLKGEVGLLKLGYRVYKSLVGDKTKGEKGLIDKLLERGIDPVSSMDNGVFFNFHRAGKGTDTIYTVTVYQEEQSDGAYRNKTHKIDDTLISRLGKEAFDLSTLYPTPTIEEVERIVKEGATAVDEILGKKSTSTSSSSSSSASASASASEDDVTGVDTSSLSATVSDSDDDLDLEMEHSINEVQSKDTSTNDLGGDADDFLKSLGVEF